MLPLFLAAVIASVPPEDYAHLHGDVSAALAAFPAERAQLERRVGPDQAIDLGERLVADEGIFSEPKPDGYTEADWSATLDAVIRGDIEAVSRAATWTEPRFQMEQGLHESFVRSPVDGLWEPVAVYVPAHHAAKPPVAFLIHGAPQSEMELLGQPYFRTLADGTGTILVAPWGRGRSDLDGKAAQDFLALVPLAQKTFETDARHLYLVGYSVGAFTAFRVGTMSTWSGIMCIGGAILNNEMPLIRHAWRTTPVYVVNGSHDRSIWPVYGMQTAEFLSSIGVSTSFYQQPGGGHEVRTIMPALTRAWTDMHQGVTRADSVPRGSADAFLPETPKLHDGDFRP